MLFNIGVQVLVSPYVIEFLLLLVDINYIGTFLAKHLVPEHTQYAAFANAPLPRQNNYCVFANAPLYFVKITLPRYHIFIFYKRNILQI